MLGLKVKMEVVRPPTGEEHQQALKTACGAMMQEHHKENTDRHFQAGNTVRYGYKRRRDKYMWKKLAQTGQNVDLVNSGDSRRRCTGPVTPSVAAAGNGDKETVHGHFNLHFDWTRPNSGTRRRRRKAKTHVDAGGQLVKGRKAAARNVTNNDMKKELASWADSEVKEAVDRLAKGYMDQIRRDAGKRHTTLG